MGCARGQGYHYGQPLSAPQLRRMLADKRLLAAQIDSADESQLTSRRLAG